MTDLLVIGYGNDLRSDDGAGRVVADAIAALELPGVVVKSVSQLTPELAIDIAVARCVVFVDADVEVREPRVAQVAAGGGTRGVMTHHGDPASMLTLAGTMGGVPDEAVVISIPASNLDLGFELSEPTAAGVATAIAHIEKLVETIATGRG